MIPTADGQRKIMKLEILPSILKQIHGHGAAAYPEEGAGLMLGHVQEDIRLVKAILPLTNAREDAARHNRYLLTAQDMLKGEQEAARLGLDILGIFHSHPDHPDRPSEFDREWALPWFSYVITRVDQGTAISSRSWRLTDGRDEFEEEIIMVIQEGSKAPLETPL
jgi:proteasome lid subunit RPN8/RPN11